MFSIRICLELVVYFLVLVFLNNISLTFVSKKKIHPTANKKKKKKPINRSMAQSTSTANRSMAFKTVLAIAKCYGSQNKIILDYRNMRKETVCWYSSTDNHSTTLNPQESKRKFCIFIDKNLFKTQESISTNRL